MGKLSNSLTNKKIKEDKENFFHVEKVINKRVRNGRTEYLIKWKDYSEKYNSWEPEKNLNKECIDEYYNKMNNFAKKRKNSESDDENENDMENMQELRKSKKKRISNDDRKIKGYINQINLNRGIVCDKTPDSIVGATDVTGELVFLVKYNDTNTYNLIPASVANIKFPQTVIKFYEAHYVLKN